MVMVTSVVLLLSWPTWLFSTSAVTAPPQAGNLKLVTEWAAAQSGAYDFWLRRQVDRSYGLAPTPEE